MLHIVKIKEFWIGCYFSSLAFLIALLLQPFFLPTEFQEKGRKKLCELKQLEYCTKKELLKTIK